MGEERIKRGLSESVGGECQEEFKHPFLQWRHEMIYDLFICHASEDKNRFVHPLAEMLRAKGLNLWYDKFCLKIGDSLRQSIDRGLADSRYGLVVLSENFFKKNWPQKELDGLSALEKVILPVWHRVDADYVKKYSPLLAGIVAIPTSKDLEYVGGKIIEKVFVYRVMDHHGRDYPRDLSKCVADPNPIVQLRYCSDPRQIQSEWIKQRMRENTELRIYHDPSWNGGTRFVVDVRNQEGVVINLEQLHVLRPTTTTTTSPPVSPRG